MDTEDRDRWQQVEAHLDAALDLPDAERLSYIDQIEDTALRGEVSQLVKQAGITGDFLDDTVLSGAPDLIAELEDQLDPTITQFEPGRLLGPYRLVERIGQGGMGVVYRAERADGHFKKQVAVKLMNRGVEDESARTRFMSETQILADIEHPNVARLLDGGVTDEGFLYIVMEYIEGRPIDRHCDARAMTIPERIGLFLTICQAVDAAHQRGIVHRDLKPGNILVTADGKVKLLDFGIAKLTAPGDPTNFMSLTQTGFLLMTPDYAAPEQLLDVPITPATDVYALGLLLYKLLAGVSPYSLKSVSPAAVERIVCEEKVRKPSDIAEPEENRKQLRGDLDRILLKALEKKPEKRFQTAGEFADQLQQAIEGLRPITAPTIPALTTDTTPVRLSEQESAELTRDVGRQRRRRARWLASAAVGGAIALAAVGLFSYLRPRLQDGQEPTTSWQASDPSSIAGANTVVLLPWTDSGTGSRNEYLAGALQTTLSQRLLQNPDWIVRSVSHESTVPLDGDPVAVSRELGAEYATYGSYRVDGNLIEIAVQLLEMPAGNAIWTDRWTQPSNDLAGLVRRLGDGLESHLNGTEPHIREPRDIERTPDGSKATELYLRGLSHTAADRYGPAANLLRRAVGADPELRAARLELARAELELARQTWSESDYLAAESGVEQLLAVVPDAHEERLLRAQLWIETNRVERTFPELYELVAEYPLDARIYWTLADAYLYGGLVDASMASGRTAQAIDPTAGRHPLLALAYSGEQVEFRDSIAGNSDLQRFSRGLAYLHLGQEPLARLQFEPIVQTASGRLKPLVEGWIAAIDGRVDAGRTITRELTTELLQIKTLDGQEAYRVAQLANRLGETETALRLLEASIEHGFFCSHCLRADPLLESLSGAQKFKQLQDRAATRTMRLRPLVERR